GGGADLQHQRDPRRSAAHPGRARDAWLGRARTMLEERRAGDTMESDTGQGPSTVYVGLEGATRLEAPLLPGERREDTPGTRVERDAAGAAVLRAGDQESVVEGLDVEPLRRFLSAIDGVVTVAEIRQRLAGDLSPETVDALLGSLVGGILRIRA